MTLTDGKSTVVPSETFTLLVRLLRQVSQRRRRQFALLLLLMILSALTEVISLGAVLPFLGILSAPEKVLGHPAMSGITAMLRISSAEELVLPLTVIFVIAALVAAGARLVLLWASTQVTYAAGADLGIEIYRKTLYQPYQVHVTRNSSEIVSGLTYKLGAAVNVLYQWVLIASSTVLLVAIVVTLIYVDAVVAGAVAIGFGGAYGVVSWLNGQQLRRNSVLIAKEQTRVIRALQEGLGGVRNLLLDGTQSFYCDIYRRADHPLRKAQAINNFIALSPRYVMEAVGMVLIAALAYALHARPGGIAGALPLLGVLALGAQRLLPALQQMYSAWASIAGTEKSLIDTIDLLEQPLPPEALRPSLAPLAWRENIRLENVSFSYSGSGQIVLENLTLSIPRGSRIGFIGKTGSGKSTTLDILMGLLEPTSGQVLVDGQAITGSTRQAWRHAIAHVPQDIYLADSTIAENIAFGVPRHEIDMTRVKEAARRAQLADFIESQDRGYDIFVGERGVRLSGGQRQRIGIARALYKRASVLVFDEATSALDHATERAVLDSIENLDRDLTILIIAHRLSTVQRCDTIVELEHGGVTAQGTYSDLVMKRPGYRQAEARLEGSAL